MTKKTAARVAILMGSNTDMSVMKDAADALDRFEIPHDMHVLSAHRTPDAVAKFAEAAAGKGIQVLIAGAGGAAHLPGMIASYTALPVIGVPVPIGPLQGQDALHSIVQMPKGVPVATVAIGNAWNAGVLAAQILAAGGAQPDSVLLKKLDDYKAEMKKKVLDQG